MHLHHALVLSPYLRLPLVRPPLSLWGVGVFLRLSWLAYCMLPLFFVGLFLGLFLRRGLGVCPRSCAYPLED